MAALQLTFTISSGTRQVSLPMSSTGILSVNWGDGNTDNLKTHTYAINGTYNVSITISGGSITQFGNGASGWLGNNYLTSVTSFGNVGLQSFYGAFNGCSNLISVPNSLPSTVTQLPSCFAACSIFNSSNVSSWDVTNVTSMNNMFEFASAFNQSLNSWNISNVNNLSSIFKDASAFNQPLNNWNTTNVINFGGIFQNAISFNQPLNNWDTSKNTNFNSIFYGATSFNQNISSWNTSSGQFMINMFRGASSFNQPLNSWNTSAVTNMDFMFNTSSSFNQALNSWDTSNVNSMNNMFFNASRFNQNIGSWNISKVTNFTNFLNGTKMSVSNMNNLFNGWVTRSVIPNRTFDAVGRIYNQDAFNSVQTLRTSPNNWTINATYDTTSLQLSFIVPANGTVSLPLTYTGILSVNWDDGTINSSTSRTYTNANTYNILISVSGGSITQFGNGTTPWTGCNYLTEFNSFGSVGLISLNGAFNECNSLTAVTNTLPSTVTNLSNCFYNNSGFNQPLNSWNTSNVTNMIRMFNSATAFNQPLNSWNTSNVTNMSIMFQSASAFNQPLNSWNTSNVTNINNMFNNASIFNQNIGSWNTSNVTNMVGIFYNAITFNQPLNSWNTSNVTDMSSMFRNALLFNQPLNSWNTSNVTIMFSMFLNATLFNQNIGSWNISNVTNFNNFLNNTNVSIFNMNDLFNGWVTRSVQPNLTFDAVGRTYNRDGYNSVQTLSTSPNNWTINATYDSTTCFLEGTKICCFIDNKEIYVPIEKIKKGTLVKTSVSGYKPVSNIGTSSIFNIGNKERVKARLYKCSQSVYPELFEDLYITGCHSILVDSIPEEYVEEIKEMVGKIYITEDKYRLLACIDKRTEPYEKEGHFNIWHVALENENYYYNYGIYANGLLVESCSNRYLTELSSMKLFD